MTSAARLPLLSYAEYLALERETDVRHEFLRGEAWAMAGGTPRHSKVKLNLLALVDGRLGAGPCQAYDSDLKLRVDSTGLATYADLAIVCGPIRRDAEDRNAVTNPSAVFEVLSPSTERWDRGAKFHHMQTVGSLRSYVLISPDEPRVEVFTRLEDGTWRLSSHGAGEVATVELGEAEIRVEVDALYRNLPEDDADQASGRS